MACGSGTSTAPRGAASAACSPAPSRRGIGTLYIKSGDAGNIWSQFNKPLVGALQRGGLDVCAWQFVYGERPVAEAKVGAAAVRRGADCLVIDAEGQYEGKYAAAERYIRALRGRIGAAFPLSLAAFPYVDYHPSFPYSVFLGPEGAIANQPQMYWKAIGSSVRAVYEHTFLFNRIWDRPLYPLGQTYGGAARGDILRFRRFAESYGGLAPSWWDWQETSRSGWSALGRPDRRAGFRLPPGRLASSAEAGQQRRHGRLGPAAPAGRGRAPAAGHRHLRQAHPLGCARIPGQPGPCRPTGRSARAPGARCLNFDPVRPRWAGRRAKREGGATASRAFPPRRPLSASLPARAYEIDPGPAP